MLYARECGDDYHYEITIDFHLSLLCNMLNSPVAEADYSGSIYFHESMSREIRKKIQFNDYPLIIEAENFCQDILSSPLYFHQLTRCPGVMLT